MPSIDRLSGLPDDILCRILSFLPTKLSVATTILARRWRFLWAYVPNLEFIRTRDMNYFNDCGIFVLDIIKKVMLLYKVQNMITFRLYCNNVYRYYQLEECIVAAIVRNVKSIDLSLFVLSYLPHCIFTCKTLVDLRLKHCGIFMYDGAHVCLPALKKLHLECVQFELSDESLPHLLSGCPVLEELIVDRFVNYPDIFCCYISSPTIKRMMFNSMSPFRFEPYREAYRLKIDTPALRYLQLHDSMFEVVSAGALASLDEADIILECDELVEGDVFYSHSVIEFVGRFYNVKCLKLSTAYMNVPDSTFSALTIIKFQNLTKLEIAADWRFLSSLLENADNLEVLSIRKTDTDLKCWMDPRQVPECLISHLRSVRIDQLGHTEHEFDMIRYILRNAKVLERMEIYLQHHGTYFEAKYQALKRISSACELVFH